MKLFKADNDSGLTFTVLAKTKTEARMVANSRIRFFNLGRDKDDHHELITGNGVEPIPMERGIVALERY
jgi:hypothetical protein